MATLQELLAQRDALERQIEETTSKGRAEAIETIRALMDETGVTLADIGGRSSRSSTASEGKPARSMSGAKVAAKYRDPETGKSWSGRGLKPRWMTAALAAGKKVEDFAV